MLRDIGYPDIRAAELLAEGFPLVGELDESGVFETRAFDQVIRGADMRWLHQTAKLAQEQVIEKLEKVGTLAARVPVSAKLTTADI